MLAKAASLFDKSQCCLHDNRKALPGLSGSLNPLRSPSLGHAEVNASRFRHVLIKQEEPVEEPRTYLPVSDRAIAVGDKVKLRAFGSIGIVDAIKDGEAEVRVKALRFREKLDNLELVEEAPEAKPQKGKLEKLQNAARTEVHLNNTEKNNRSELNVIGQTTDEAVDAVDKFLDEASLASLSQVRIVHGHDEKLCTE